MRKKCLITGGAGFIGSHLADELLEAGYQVVALDNLDQQVHQNQRPDYLNPEVQLIEGDVGNPETVARALRGVDVVYHFAAKVGVGQSMYEIDTYTRVNNCGTATLLKALTEHPVERLIVASSMSVYGEGRYRDAGGKIYDDVARSFQQVREGRWEPCNAAGEPLYPVATPEEKTPELASVYALGKYDQEKLCLIVGQAYDIPTTALRFFNVYGTRQALSNPYTGVLAIFASRYLNGNPPVIFEDGNQIRDFVNVCDVARACRLAMEKPDAAGEVLNIGSGNKYTIKMLTHTLGTLLNKEYLEPEISGKYRIGDIRHCYADISKAKRLLGYEPEISLEEGMEELAGWLEGRIANDLVEKASFELSRRGLTI